jgi:CspA family cold shock protein
MIFIFPFSRVALVLISFATAYEIVMIDYCHLRVVPSVRYSYHSYHRNRNVLVPLGRDPYCARSTLETEMPTGTVKWFNPTKGYGFIQPTGGGGKDVFVHISAVERAGLGSLNEGQTVEYEIQSERGKESATNLRVK